MRNRVTQGYTSYRWQWGAYGYDFSEARKQQSAAKSLKRKAKKSRKHKKNR